MAYSTFAQCGAPFASVQYPGTNPLPSQAQVEAWAESHSNDLDVILTGLGYAVPTDPASDGYLWLVESNRLYVGAQIGYALGSASETENPTAVYLKRLYDERMKQLQSGLLDSIFDTAGDASMVGAPTPDPDTVGIQAMPAAVVRWSTEW